MELYHIEQRRPVRASVLPSSPLGLLDQTETAAVLGVSAPTLRKIKANDPSSPWPSGLASAAASDWKICNSGQPVPRRLPTRMRPDR